MAGRGRPTVSTAAEPAQDPHEPRQLASRTSRMKIWVSSADIAFIFLCFFVSAPYCFSTESCANYFVKIPGLNNSSKCRLVEVHISVVCFIYIYTYMNSLVLKNVSSEKSGLLPYSSHGSQRKTWLTSQFISQKLPKQRPGAA